MNLQSFMELVVEAADEVYGEDGERPHDVDYDLQAKQVIYHIIPCVSEHIIKAAILQYKLDKGLIVLPYSPKHTELHSV